MAGEQNIELINAISFAKGTQEPTNRDVFWIDENITGEVYEQLKYFNLDSGQWELVQRTAQQLLDGIKTVDGSGSGLDADTLQGFTPAQLMSSRGGSTPPLSTGQMLVGQPDGVGTAQNIGGIATVNTSGQLAYNAGSISHLQLSDIGSNTHAQIDSHISSTANPHNVTASQVGNAISQWNADRLEGNITSIGTLGAGQDGQVLTWDNTTSRLIMTTVSGGGIDNVTTAEKLALTPATGDFVYDTDLESLQRYDGSSWIDVAKGYGGAVRYTGGLPYWYDNPKLAYNSASAGDVVKLFDNYEDTSGDSITIQAGVVIDLNGFTWTWNNAGANDMFSATSGLIRTDLVSIKNGKVIKSGGGSGRFINNTVPTTWILRNLYVSADSACFQLNGIIDSTGSYFEGDTTGSACSFSFGTKRVIGGEYKNVNATGTNNGSSDYMAKTRWEAIGGAACTVDGTVTDSVFISDGGTGLGAVASSNLISCTGISNTGDGISMFGSGFKLTGISTSLRGIDATGANRLESSVGISYSNQAGITAADYNYNCYAESQSRSAWISFTNGSKIYNCTAKVKTTSNGAIFCNANDVEVLNCTLEVASSTAYGVEGVVNVYVAGTLVKGSTLVFQGTNLWTATTDSQGNSGQV